MQLLVAHQILIGSAIALALLFGLRSVSLFARGGGAAEMATAAVSFVVAGLLVLYFRKVRARWVEQRDLRRR
jgi:hypothetical protein